VPTPTPDVGRVVAEQAAPLAEQLGLKAEARGDGAALLDEGGQVVMRAEQGANGQLFYTVPGAGLRFEVGKVWTEQLNEANMIGTANERVMMGEDEQGERYAFVGGEWMGKLGVEGESTTMAQLVAQRKLWTEEVMRAYLAKLAERSEILAGFIERMGDIRDHGFNACADNRYDSIEMQALLLKGKFIDIPDGFYTDTGEYAGERLVVVPAIVASKQDTNGDGVFAVEERQFELVFLVFGLEYSNQVAIDPNLPEDLDARLRWPEDCSMNANKGKPAGALVVNAEEAETMTILAATKLPPGRTDFDGGLFGPIYTKAVTQALNIFGGRTAQAIGDLQRGKELGGLPLLYVRILAPGPENNDKWMDAAWYGPLPVWVDGKWERSW
jgi:hypothetical protein